MKALLKIMLTIYNLLKVIGYLKPKIIEKGF